MSMNLKFIHKVLYMNLHNISYLICNNNTNGTVGDVKDMVERGACLNILLSKCQE